MEVSVRRWNNTSTPILIGAQSFSHTPNDFVTNSPIIQDGPFWAFIHSYQGVDEVIDKASLPASCISLGIVRRISGGRTLLHLLVYNLL